MDIRRFDALWHRFFIYHAHGTVLRKPYLLEQDLKAKA